MFFYDIANLLAIFIVITIAFRMGLIPLWLSFFLALFALTPFILNDFIFPASYMPDQFIYFSNVQEAGKAKKACAGIELDGRIIRVDYSLTK